ncbi:MAG: metal-dependent hydrolase [Akkermansiaceae bacterium]|nr:metal-dependent hydrolase [Akkermansiaceae bacterium]
MDSLTQAVVGAAVGELILGKKLGWRGAAWGAFFGTLPDLDIVALPFLDAAAGIRWHRGISHSILVMILASLVLAKPLARRYQARGVVPREMAWMVFWAWSTHSLVDCFTTYGTQVFDPFSNYRLAMNVFFIVDPLFTLPLLVGIVKALRLDVKDYLKRRRIMTWAIELSCLYLAFGFAMKEWAGREMQRGLAGRIPGAELVAVAPSSFNTILWRGLIETEKGYYLTYWSPFDVGHATYQYIPKNRELASRFEGDETLDALKWFSRGHWVAREGDDGTLVIVDMRFTEIRDPRHGVMQPIFQWHMSRDSEGRTLAPMLRPLGVNYPAAIALVWQRIWGGREGWEAVDGF